MSGVHEQGSVLVWGSNYFLHFLQLMMYILYPHMTRSVNGIVKNMSCTKAPVDEVEE